MTGTVKGREIKKNRDGDEKVLILQVEISDPDDLQSVELITQAGEDYNPPDDSRVIITQSGRAWKIGIAVDDKIEPSVEVGERKSYSSENGTIKAQIYYKKNGDLQLNDGDDWAVQFSALKNEFNELNDKYNDLVSKYNAHIHITTATVAIGPPGVISPTTSQGSPSSAVIDNVKIDNVRLP